MRLTLSRLHALLLPAVLILTGCSTDSAVRASTTRLSGSAPVQTIPRETWPMYQFAPTHNAVFGGTLEAKWQTALKGRVNGGLALVGDTVYVDSFSPRTYAIDVHTGRIRWSRTAQNTLMTTPIVQANAVIFGSGNNETMAGTYSGRHLGIAKGDVVFASSVVDGKPIWSFRTIGEDMPSSVLDRGLAIFANGDGHIYALDVRNGKLAWSAPIPGVASMSNANADEGVAFVASSAVEHYAADEELGYTLAFDTRTGKELWRSQHGNGDCSPTVADGYVFVEDVGYEYYGPNNLLGDVGKNYVYALDEKTGAVRWRFKSGRGFFNAIASFERAIAGTYDRGTYYQALPATSEFIAFNAKTGAVKWQMRTNGPVKMSAIVANDLVIFGDGAGLLYILSAKDGSVVAVHAFRRPFGPSPPLLAGKTLLVVNGDRVYALPFEWLLHRSSS